MRYLELYEMERVVGGASYLTAGGNSFDYNPATALSQAQRDVLGSIVDYGFSHLYSKEYIKIAVDQAFYESSLGSIESNPSNSGVEGLYQYDAATWSDLGHSALNRASDADQIAAMFNDISNYSGRWADGLMNGTIPANLSFEDYIEVKHHLGNNSTDWTNPVVSQYEGKVTVLGLTVVEKTPTGGGGGGGSGSSPGGTGGSAPPSGSGTGSGTVTVGGPDPVHTRNP